MKLRGGHRLKSIYFSVLLALIPVLTILVLFTGDIINDRGSTGPSKEYILSQQLTELKEKLNHVEMLNQQRKIEVNYLRETIKAFSSNNVSQLFGSGNPFSFTGNLKADQQRQDESLSTSSDLMKLPSLVNFLPHLLKYDDPLSPAFRRVSSRYPAGRTGVNLVLGIPTVKRPVQSYLVATLRNLIDNMNMEERAEVLIVVFIAETDLSYVKEQVSLLESEFSDFIDSGLMEIISPPKSYYPDFDSTLKPTLGDPMERVIWRSKQNLDFAYLMMYCQPKGVYYVQLEDDIVTKPAYLTKMKTAALKHSTQKKDWFIIDFCSLGFIGKMIKSVDLSFLIIFFIMFHNDKPVDWLLFSIGNVRYCRIDGTEKQCRQAISRHWIQHRPSLFQHIGTHSSLKGKVQKLREKGFGKVTGFYPHTDNPTAVVRSTIKQYQTYSIVGAYEGYTYFWGLSPKSGDYILIDFTTPIIIEKFFIRSSNWEHPEDKFYNATIEVKPLFKLAGINGSNTSINTVNNVVGLNQTADGFIVVGEFKQSSGIAEGSCTNLGAVKMLRIYCHADSDKWVLINELYIKPKLT